MRCDRTMELSDTSGCAERGSADFEEFLEFLGDKVPLVGWSKFRGGLQVDAAANTGSHSLYTNFHDFEVMFHVSTYLPFRPHDPQQARQSSVVRNG
jgi:RAP1 GTPase activating protein 1